ncbi:MAG TPA: CopD family protein, partial [Aggregatilineales bacterium]|nr:CopD family protein [Aggregatilineales bacterium]
MLRLTKMHAIGMAAAILAVIAIRPSIVSAHAVLLRSDPSPNAILDAAPSELHLMFSEPLELSLSHVQILDSLGHDVTGQGELRPDAQDSDWMILPLPDLPLPHGIYTVAWATVSQADGHSASGSFAFAIGTEIGTEFTPTVTTPATQWPTAFTVIARWISYLSLALLLGGFAFIPLVYWRSTKDRTLPISLTRQMRAGWVLAIAAVVLSILAYGDSLDTLPALPGLLIASRYGLLLTLRALILIALLGLMLFQRTIAPRIWVWAGIATCAVALLTVSLASHATATDSPFASVLADWLHLVATNIWAGGLVALLITLIVLHREEKTGAIAKVVARFSDVAALCVLILVVTGVYRSIYEIEVPGNLLDTAYGQTLLVKLGLFALLMALAAINQLVIKPGLQRTVEGISLRRLILRTVGLEIGFVTLVLLVTGVLTNLATSREAFGSDETLYRDTGDFRVILALTPAKPGFANYDVYLRDGIGHPVDNVFEVVLRFNMVERDLGETAAVAKDQGDGHYNVHGAYIALPGTWHIRATVRRSGQDDTQVAFTVPMTLNGIPLAPAPIISMRTLIGLEIVL